MQALTKEHLVMLSCESSAVLTKGKPGTERTVQGDSLCTGRGKKLLSVSISRLISCLLYQNSGTRYWLALMHSLSMHARISVFKPLNLKSYNKEVDGQCGRDNESKREGRIYFTPHALLL